MGLCVPLGFTGLWFEPECNMAIRGPIGQTGQVLNPNSPIQEGLN